MALPDSPVPEYAKDMLERTLDDIIKHTNGDKVSQADLNRVSVAAQIQEGIDLYRAQAEKMSRDQLETEKHNSARLSRHLEEAGQKRPPRCHAHAIVAGKQKYAAELRVLMAILKIRIDDSDNGCCLPENTAATPHPAFPSALPHSRIHRYNYYFWINSRLSALSDAKNLRTGLQLIARMLQQNTCPSYVMLKKGQGLPKGGRFV